MPHEKTNGKNRELKEDLHRGGVENHLEHINREFRQGFDFIKNYPKSVTIFGSSLTLPENPLYGVAEKLAARIVSETKYAIITGGGPGIMEAANKGAIEGQKTGYSAGLSISLPHEHSTNLYASESMKFSYFFTRKTMLTFAAEAYIFFPGGYGTFDELFSILTLIQTGKIPHVPVIMVCSEYWNEVDHLLQKVLLGTYHTIDSKDAALYEITDSLDLVIERIKKAPVSEWWRNIN